MCSHPIPSSLVRLFIYLFVYLFLFIYLLVYLPQNISTIVFTHLYSTMMKQSLCLDNDGSTIETSDSISSNFLTEVFQQTSQNISHIFDPDPDKQ